MGALWFRECRELRLRLRSGEEGKQKNSLGGRSAGGAGGASSPMMGKGGMDMLYEWVEERSERA